MAVILKRTIFASRNKDGIIQFHDHAEVVTPLGAMIEPFFANQVPLDGSARDYTDEMQRIDEIRFIPAAQRKAVLSDGEMVLHGGEYPNA